MKLVASMMTKNEMGRYLRPCIEHLLEFCDEVRVLDDGSTDGTREYLEATARVDVIANDGPPMFEHEGQARNRLLDWTLAGQPSHVISVDADEFVTNGAAVRRACGGDQGPGVWLLSIQEVWRADAQYLWLRHDGKWDMQSTSPLLWRAPRRAARHWRIPNVQMACGREPLAVRQVGRRGRRIEADVLHFGWTNVGERKARHQRYVEHDGGRFHNITHLNSIMWPDSRVRVQRREWPAALERWKVQLTTRVAA